MLFHMIDCIKQYFKKQRNEEGKNLTERKLQFKFNPVSRFFPKFN